MPESTVSIPSGATSIAIDVATLTAIISNVAATVARQIMVIGDPNTSGAQAIVSAAAGLQVEGSVNTSMAQMLAELRAIRYLLMHMSDRDVSPDITDTDIN